jgi:hypothetical protein
MLECDNCGIEAKEELKTVFVNSIFKGYKWEERFCQECYDVIEKREGLKNAKM